MNSHQYTTSIFGLTQASLHSLVGITTTTLTSSLRMILPTITKAAGPMGLVNWRFKGAVCFHLDPSDFL